VDGKPRGFVEDKEARSLPEYVELRRGGRPAGAPRRFSGGVCFALFQGQLDTRARRNTVIAVCRPAVDKYLLFTERPVQGGKRHIGQGLSQYAVKAAAGIIIMGYKGYVLDKAPFTIHGFIMALKGLIENPVFLSVISSLFFAQLIKTIIYLRKSRQKKTRDTIEIMIWRTGGMPSSHSAMVSSMTASVAFIEGIHTNLFVVTVMFALIIIRDALGVRRSSGIQAKVLNWLGRQAADKLKIEYHPVKEVNGHSPLEVAVGVLLGFIIAAAFCFL
jgi:acid phosphatase family membrane protein YuiD